MCGIAGVVDLAGERQAPTSVLRAMSDAIYHRGPDEDGYLDRPGLGLASRRLSIVGLADGRQPIGNEDRTVWVVFNGELFNYREKRRELEVKGHRFATHTDTELLPHLWEEYGEGMFDHLRGQFAFCLWDSRQNCLILARDRVGICPLFWTLQRPREGPLAGADCFLFASEIKGLLASGMVEARPDLRGINQVFSFFAVPGPMTCFQGVNLILPGRYLRVQLGNGSPASAIREKVYWEIDFPDWGHEENPRDSKRVVDDFERVLYGAVDRRLWADVPVVSYLSGGVDSSLVVAMACKALGRPIPTFTISIQEEGLNEESEAAQTARHIGAQSVVVNCGDREVRGTYPELIEAAEVPVVDTSCAALLMLAKSVRDNGYKVALTGEGADEFIAGYSWFKINKILSWLDVIPGMPLGQWLRQFGLRVTGQPRFPWETVRRTQEIVGGHNGWLDLYGLMSLSKLRFFAPHVKEELANRSPYEDLELNREKLKRWHPFNRALYLGARIMLSGHLLCSKGDRVAMNSSVETRYPFLDEDVIAFLAKLHPRWKLHGLRDKYVERCVAARWLPKEIAWRRKAMFRAPMDSFHLNEGGRQAGEGGVNLDAPPSERWIDQVLGRESLRKTGYFDADAVLSWRAALPRMRKSLKRTSVELGLVAVTATQLWHHLYISGDLADLPSRVRRPEFGTRNEREPLAAAPR